MAPRRMEPALNTRVPEVSSGRVRHDLGGCAARVVSDPLIEQRPSWGYGSLGDSYVVGKTGFEGSVPVISGLCLEQ